MFCKLIDDVDNDDNGDGGSACSMDLVCRGGRKIFTQTVNICCMGMELIPFT